MEEKRVTAEEFDEAVKVIVDFLSKVEPDLTVGVKVVYCISKLRSVLFK